jgi:hypothetical protein
VCRKQILTSMWRQCTLNKGLMCVDFQVVTWDSHTSMWEITMKNLVCMSILL